MLCVLWICESIVVRLEHLGGLGVTKVILGLLSAEVLAAVGGEGSPRVVVWNVHALLASPLPFLVEPLDELALRVVQLLDGGTRFRRLRRTW